MFSGYLNLFTVHWDSYSSNLDWFCSHSFRKSFQFSFNFSTNIQSVTIRCEHFVYDYLPIWAHSYRIDIETCLFIDCSFHFSLQRCDVFFPSCMPKMCVCVCVLVAFFCSVLCCSCWNRLILELLLLIIITIIIIALQRYAIYDHIQVKMVCSLQSSLFFFLTHFVCLHKAIAKLNFLFFLFNILPFLHFTRWFIWVFFLSLSSIGIYYWVRACMCKHVIRTKKKWNFKWNWNICI